MSGTVSLFMVGDVMLARGIDQILEYSCDPKLYEANGLDATRYVSIAESQNGPIPDKHKRGIDYIWGDAIQILEAKKPDLRLINLENSVTTSDSPWPMKGIHYRMHPQNVDVIKAAKIDCCVLSNNHTADWGFPGLVETLQTLKKAGLAYVGAGNNLSEAQAPAIFDLPGKGRILVFAAGHQSSGIPEQWKATSKRCGVNLIEIMSSSAVNQMRDQILPIKQRGDIVVLSIHWGPNWGYETDPSFQKFAHDIIDKAGVDIVHGHSSHHAKGVESYNGKLIIYGSGDYLNDYEGIGGHEKYRGDLSLMYFAQVDVRTGTTVDLCMVPTQIRHLRVNKASAADVDWMYHTMSRECKKFNSDVKKVGSELHLVFPKSVAKGK